MKSYSPFLCFVRTSIIHSFFVVFALTFLSKSVLAMPCAHDASFYPERKDDTYVHAAMNSYYGNPDYSRGYYINSGQPLTEKNRGIRKGFPHLASDGILFDHNLAKKAATQGRSIDISEHDKQVPIRRSLLSVSIRARFSSVDVLGDVAPEEFREYDVAANFRLPWAWYSPSGWGGGIRLMASAGALNGAGGTALVVSLIPLLTLGSQDGRFTLDMGAGGALLSRHHFGTQDYGGCFQFALTAGVNIPLFKRLGVGYRFLHYSDAAIYGPHNTGADFHMLELTYRF